MNNKTIGTAGAVLEAAKVTDWKTGHKGYNSCIKNHYPED